MVPRITVRPRRLRRYPRVEVKQADSGLEPLRSYEIVSLDVDNRTDVFSCSGPGVGQAPGPAARGPGSSVMTGEGTLDSRFREHGFCKWLD